jgi:hypothetical protein
LLPFDSSSCPFQNARRYGFCRVLSLLNANSRGHFYLGERGHYYLALTLY